MKSMFLKSFAAVSAALALMTFSVSAFATQPQPVPFGAQFAGDFAFNSQITAGYGGPGGGPPMGPATLDGSISIVGPGNCNGAEGFSVDHIDTIIAANGDELYVSTHDDTCQISPGSASYNCIGTWIIIGGTGRFSLATGGGVFTGTLNFTSPGVGTFNAEYAGSVSLH